MSKDPFQILADELTLIRKDMDQLQRTSLNKDEAKKLNQIVTAAVMKMAKATEDAPGEIQGALEADRDQMARSATQAATRAAESAMAGISGMTSTMNAQGSHRPPERPVGRHGAGLVGSGCGWPLCSPQGPLSGRWRWPGLRGAAMPASSGSSQASIATRRAGRI